MARVHVHVHVALGVDVGVEVEVVSTRLSPTYIPTSIRKCSDQWFLPDTFMCYRTPLLG